MATYSIYIQNFSAKTQTFYLFNEVPEHSDITQVYSNVYAKGRPTGKEGAIQSFSVTSDAYAVCGYQEIKEKAIIAGKDNTVMSLTGSIPNTAHVVVVGGGPHFERSTGGASAGTFQIEVGEFDQGPYPDVYVGYGRKGAKQFSSDKATENVGYEPGVKLVASWQADPQNTYILTPKVSFYVATGNYQEGEAVILQQVGKKVLVDFTTQGNNVYASLGFDSKGNFTLPTYSPTPPQMQSGQYLEE